MKRFDDAVASLRSGGLVAFPTETVYGLGADPDNRAAVEQLLAAMDSPPDKPSTIHLGPAGDPSEWGRFDRGSRALADAFWPGSLTLILPWRSRVPTWVTGGRDSVGLRVVAHEVGGAMLDAFGNGVAASSANRAGHPPPVSADQVRQTLGGHVEVVVEGGETPSGLSSTILSLLGAPTLLRAGAIEREQLQDVLGTLIS